MMDNNELSYFQGKANGSDNVTKEMKNSAEEQLQFTDVTIMELRDLLTFVKGYKQIIDVKHPEVKSFEHWDEMDADINAMADRLITYDTL
jgi:hypothetical protein